MRIGLNFYFNDNLIGVNVSERSKNEIKVLFGGKLNYHDVDALLKSKPNIDKEVLTVMSGDIKILIFHLDDSINVDQYSESTLDK